jgi:hypothetical protein
MSDLIFVALFAIIFILVIAFLTVSGLPIG